MNDKDLARLVRKQKEILFVADDASGMDEKDYKIATIWADRVLVFGSPWPRKNFFLRERNDEQ